MKLFNKSLMMGATLLLAVGFAACEDACDYDDAYTDNPSWSNGQELAHPDSLTGQVWVRGEGIKFNAYGEEVQGYVESMNFFSADSMFVTMSKGTTSGTMGVDHSNTRENPYKYEYVKETGSLNVVQTVIDDKGRRSEVTIFSGVAVTGTKFGDMLTVAHYGDTPVQTYLVRE